MVWQPSPGNCCAFLYPYIGFNVEQYDVTGWKNGMNAWTTSPAYIGYYQGGSSSSITLSDYYNSNSIHDGVTVWYSSGGFFTQATAYLNYYWTSGYSTWLIQGTAVHELGHVAGLDHEGGCVMMNPDATSRESCGINTPQPDDDAGINVMY